MRLRECEVHSGQAKSPSSQPAKEPAPVVVNEIVTKNSLKSEQAEAAETLDMMGAIVLAIRSCPQRIRLIEMRFERSGGALICTINCQRKGTR
jgi:hypothetical protein